MALYKVNKSQNLLTVIMDLSKAENHDTMSVRIIKKDKLSVKI